jgi:hypothetical protein
MSPAGLAALLSCTILVIDEGALFKVGRGEPPLEGRKLITDLTALREVKELGSSRFGAVRLLRRPNPAGDGFEYLAAKLSHAGQNPPDRLAFDDRIAPFLDLSHPHGMPLLGVFPPPKAGPVFLAEYGPNGSLEDVLERVRRNDPPPFWNDAGKARMIVSLASVLHCLHNAGLSIGS